MIYAVQIWFVQLKMVKLFAPAQVNLNSFRVMLKTVAYVIFSHAHPIMIVIMEFVVMVNVRSHAEIKMTVPMVNIV